jgi:hypothetical protein
VADTPFAAYAAIALAAGAVQPCKGGHGLLRVLDNDAERRAFAEVILAFQRRELPGASLSEAVGRMVATLDATPCRCRACEP